MSRAQTADQAYTPESHPLDSRLPCSLALVTALLSRFGGSKNKDKACELYEQAAAAYKMNDNWAEASGALLKCAEILEKQKDSLEAAAHYVEAGLCMARVDNEEAIKLLEMGIAIHTNEARLGAAARVWKELAQLHEEEENLQAAIDAWRKAADCQESEGTLAGALQSLLRVGELHVKVRRTRLRWLCVTGADPRVRTQSVEALLQAALSSRVFRCVLCYCVIVCSLRASGVSIQKGL